MENFSPISAAIGGVLIGLSAGLLWVINGRIAGISGVLGGALPFRPNELGWRALFLAALAIGAGLTFRIGPSVIPAISNAPLTFSTSLTTLGIAGLLVGIGTRLSGGCTSGHGVCGLARLSLRSLTAVVTFMAVAAITVFITRHVL